MATGNALVVATVMVVFLLVAFIALYFRYRGKRIVMCPETEAPVALEINAPLAAGMWIVSEPRYLVTACSRWPERAGCDQACTLQVDAAPDTTRVHNIVAKWYAERTCVYCANAIREISGSAIAPALRLTNGELREWSDVPAEDLPRILASAAAVCARCELTEDFRRRFLDRVIERPAMAMRHRVVADASHAVY